MTLLTNLLISFACNFCDFGVSFEEAPATQASILQRVEPGLLATYDSAKTTIRE